jgi:hypothetical protein
MVYTYIRVKREVIVGSEEYVGSIELDYPVWSVTGKFWRVFFKI